MYNVNRTFSIYIRMQSLNVHYINSTIFNDVIYKFRINIIKKLQFAKK